MNLIYNSSSSSTTANNTSNSIDFKDANLHAILNSILTCLQTAETRIVNNMNSRQAGAGTTAGGDDETSMHAMDLKMLAMLFSAKCT